MIIRLFFLMICAATSVIIAPMSSCAQEPVASGSPIRIRVAVVKAADSVKMFIAGNFKMIDSLSGSVLLEEKYLAETEAAATDAGFKLDGKEINASAFSIEPVGGSRVYINGRIFRGEIRIFKDGMKLTVVNVVDL